MKSIEKLLFFPGAKICQSAMILASEPPIITLDKKMGLDFSAFHAQKTFECTVQASAVVDFTLVLSDRGHAA